MLLLAALLSVAPQGGPYDPDPKHPWNELHQALFTWRPVPASPKIPAGLQTDPLFWPMSAEAWTFSAALLPVLDRFLENKSDALVKDPLRRAILQHDLWLFFDGLEGMPQGGGRSVAPEGETERDGARRRIARLMRRLALKPEEVRALPEGYAAAVSSGRHPAAVDPERPFLPADLLDPKGPWILLGREDGVPAAELHVKHFRGRSVFLAYASLPGGSEETLAYLRRLGALKNSVLRENSPPGTRLLLLRRPFLLDAEGRPHLSPLVEEVRIRLSLADPRPGTAGSFEFHLDRKDLFAGVSGGLQAAGPTDEAALFFFHRGSSKDRIRATCQECHGLKATPTSLLRFGGRDRATSEMLVSARPMKASTVDQEAEATATWKQADPSWTLLRNAWPKE